MVFSVTYITCEGPKLDAQRYERATFANCQHATIC